MLLDFDINKETFKKDFMYREPHLFKNAVNSDGFTWNNINELYSRGDISHRDFKLMNGYEVDKDEYVEAYDNLGATEYRCIKSTLYELDILKSYILQSFLGDTPLGFHISLADIISDVGISLPVVGSIGI